jgi:hypothetical protein
LLTDAQVNGVDVSGSQERALEELSRAQEPILVHIKRKEQEQEVLNDNDSNDQAEDVVDEEEEEEDDEDEYDDDQIVIPDLEYQVKERYFSCGRCKWPPPPLLVG